MNAIEIIEKYYNPTSELYKILINHSRSVSDKALAIARLHPKMNLDLQFIEEASMLHDIGIIFCNAPDIKCYGDADYICHGYLGAELLRKEGFPRHAFVCERHTGTGLTKAEVEKLNLPIPKTDYMPVSLEEQLICFADKFYSKTNLEKEKAVDRIHASLSRFGEDCVLRFDNWCKLFLIQ